uniref:Uncharacterized protein n=1 Tax=Romanomermis culicivorax TaxID=13658 RepID=A0A915HV52_ROMCU
MNNSLHSIFSNFDEQFSVFKVEIKISDRKIPNIFNKHLLCALNPALTQETQEKQEAQKIVNIGDMQILLAK